MDKVKTFFFRCWKWGTVLVFWAKNEEDARKQYEDILGRPPGQALRLTL